MKTDQNKRGKTLPTFISTQLEWAGLRGTPEWESFEDAWKRGELRVAAVALEVVQSHWKEKISKSGALLLRGLAGSLRRMALSR